MVEIILFGIIAAAAEILGGIMVVMRKVWPRKIQEYLIALSAGFLLALVFFELIPESFRLLGPLASLYLLGGFALLHLFEHTLVRHLHFGEEVHSDVMLSRAASISTFMGLAIHAFFDGFSIAAGMSYNFYIGLLVFFAILLHKFPEGFTLATVMLAAQQTRRNALLASTAIGIATLAGVGAVFLISSVDHEVIGVAFALSGGIATYVGASDLIPEINKSGNRVTPVVVLAGMALFYAANMLLGWTIPR